MKMPAFLSAEWRNLALLNFEMDPRALQSLVPAGTELDDFEGRFFISLVGFQFRHTRVLGVPVPFHQNFPEVNLRFYVRRKVGTEWRRGVVFVREIVPRWAIAFVARNLYGEPYLALPMREKIVDAESLNVCYEWKFSGFWNRLEATACGPLESIADGSVEEFIAEHYWGYTARGMESAEYEVRHPRWKIRPAESRFECAVTALYGEKFCEPLSVPPISAFIAEGSAAEVRFGEKLAG